MLPGDATLLLRWGECDFRIVEGCLKAKVWSMDKIRGGENQMYTVSAYPSSLDGLGVGSNDSVLRRLLLPYARAFVFSYKKVSKRASGLVGDSTSLVCENASFTDNTLTFGTSVSKK